MTKKNNILKTNVAVQCHWGNVEIFTTKYSTYYGGGHTRGANRGEVDVVIDLAPRVAGYSGGTYAVSGLYSGPIMKLKGFDEHLKRVVDKEKEYTKDQVIFEIEWDDMGVPPFRKLFFEEFAAALEDGSRGFLENHGRKRKILVMCAGGHGRTGTLLATLALINNIIPGDKDVLKNMRLMYCENCIETFSQAELIVQFCKESFTFSLPAKKEALLGTQSDLYLGNSKEYKFPESKGGKHGDCLKKVTSWEKEDLGIGGGTTLGDEEYDFICDNGIWRERSQK